jgi:hypothetical protein
MVKARENILYTFIYIYMCVCVCVWMRGNNNGMRCEVSEEKGQEGEEFAVI